MLFGLKYGEPLKGCNGAYSHVELSPRKILFGVDSNQSYDLNLFLLLAKWFIWKQSKNESVVTVRLLLVHLRSFYNVQACVYSMNGKAKEHGCRSVSLW